MPGTFLCFFLVFEIEWVLFESLQSNFRTMLSHSYLVDHYRKILIIFQLITLSRYRSVISIIIFRLTTGTVHLESTSFLRFASQT